MNKKKSPELLRMVLDRNRRKMVCIVSWLICGRKQKTGNFEAGVQEKTPIINNSEANVKQGMNNSQNLEKQCVCKAFGYL